LSSRSSHHERGLFDDVVLLHDGQDVTAKLPHLTIVFLNHFPSTGHIQGSCRLFKNRYLGHRSRQSDFLWILGAWLNTPNPELSDFTPLQVIEKGKADAVADMVSSALLGTACLNVRGGTFTSGSQGDLAATL
jgi:hypothetical protein